MERKKIKVKRKLNEEQRAQLKGGKLFDEEGNEISFEDASDEMDDGEYMDDRVEEGMKNVSSDEDDDGWEDMADDEGMAVDEDKKKNAKGAGDAKKSDGDKKKVAEATMNDDEPGDDELDFDASAYEMLHRSEVEWPCLSIDVLVRQRCPEANQPMGFKNWF